MTDDRSARLALPLLQPGQAQKELFHNEALAVLDLVVQPGVVAALVDTPPDTPAPGQCWIVGTAPTGDWAGQAGQLAGWTTGGWRFVPPLDGMALWVTAQGLTARFAGGSWLLGHVAGVQLEIAGEVVVGPRRGAVADPAGGAVTDSEARAAIGAILAALRGHGLIAS